MGAPRYRCMMDAYVCIRKHTDGPTLLPDPTLFPGPTAAAVGPWPPTKGPGRGGPPAPLWATAAAVGPGGRREGGG